ncbi:translational activator of GCN4, partial [Coemansia interrupta]
MSEENSDFSWKGFIDGGFVDRITVSGVKKRCGAMEGELLPLIAAHPLEDRELVHIILALKATINLYVDRESRAAVLKVLRALAAKKAEVFVKAIAGVLDPVVESAQAKSIAHPDAIPTAVAPRFVLLSWVNLALTTPITQLGADSQALAGDAAWRRLVVLAARLLWGVAPAHPKMRLTKLNSISNSAHRDVWRMLRECPEVIAPMLGVLTTETANNEFAAVLIGNLVSSAVRLAPGKGHAEAVAAVEKCKDAIVGFIDRVLIGSKTLVSYSSVHDLGDFLRKFVGGDFVGLFKASISKMLLRSPETVLPTCLWLLESLDAQAVDLSAVYLDVFADTLASNLIKSSNASVRKDAANLFGFLANAPTSADAAAKAAEIATKPLTLGRYAQPEQRTEMYRLLGGVHAGPGGGWASAVVIVPALVKMTGKETIEQPVSALFTALGTQFGHLVEHLGSGSEEGTAECIEALKVFSEAARKGLALPDRSGMLRHAWAADAVGQALWKYGDALDGQAWAAEHIAPLLRVLLETAEKVSANPLAASGGSGTLDAHVGLALTLHSSSSAPEDRSRLAALVTGTEKSLVLWDKVYHKCTGAREALWLLRCAQVLYQGGSDDGRLGELLMWVVCRMPEASRPVARAALDTLQAMAEKDAARLWKLLEPCVVAEMAAGRRPVGGSTWRDVLAAVAGGHCGEGDKERLLVSMALAAHYPAAVAGAGSLGRQSGLWISLAQRMGVDPADLCLGRLDQLLRVAQEAMADESQAAALAAGSALVSDLVFIGGQDAAQRVLSLAHDLIDPSQLQAVSDEDLGVWRTPAGELYADPLASKAAAAGQASKNVRGKTSDDVWAEELRQELARKKNEARKLTREEQDLVDRQHAAEASTRARVERARTGLVRGLRLARAVVEGSRAVGGLCMLQLVRLVVERAMLGGGRAAQRLAGSEVRAAVEAMGTCAEGLEPGLRMPLAMGLLRVRGFAEEVPAGWTQESVEDLASRVYFRLRVTCEAQPLPAAAFNFVLPFMQATAEAGGWGRRVRRGVEEHDEYAQMDHAAEQLTMVVDLLGFHAHFGGDAAMPRKEMVDVLVYLMASQPTLLTACRGSLVRLAEEMEGADTALERDALLAGLLQPDSAVRSACLAALDYADLTEMDYSTALWINAGGAGAPALDDNAAAARLLWAENGLEVLPSLVDHVVPHLGSDAAEIRDAAARAVALAVQQLAADGEGDVEAVVDHTLGLLLAAYRRWYISLAPEYDAYGIVVAGTQNRRDPAEARVAVGRALAHLAPHLASAAQMHRLVAFLVGERVLGERAEAVRTCMLEAGAQAVAAHGAAWAAELLPELEAVLAAPDEGSFAHDCIREGVVVLLGRLAQHVPAQDAGRVAAAVDRLVDALKTPAEAVQRAVSECLPPLARRLDDERQRAAVEVLLQRTLEGESYAARRGGAYGLAGVVKGLGLAALKRHGVVDRLRAACEARAQPQARQGALFAVETLAAALGRLFEPYVIQFVPLLLALFGDASADVRAAALDAARTVMAHISGHGVKLVLPAALAGLADDGWRTKKGSVEMLGAMAFCAPKQLSLALPAIVPRIVTVLADAHGQVAAAARAALLRFGDVIHNPEIQALVPTLLAALDDPAAKTDAALVRLLHTPFVHYIDAPSLALVVPVLQRGMRGRAASTKRTAAQIMGAMATLTEPADLAPYLAELVPLVRGVLVDPVPEARATAAKALGALVQRLGEARFPSLVADLVRVLKSDASGVDRAGAAQGLSEVLAGVGLARLEGLLAEVVANCRSAQPAVREGFVLLLIYLPTTFGDAFRPFLPRVVPPVLGALADDVEVVRTAALRAGRILVASFAAGEGVDLLLPALLAAMHDAAWRIRHSAVELLGELLLRVAGVSGKQAERDREAARALFFAKQTPDEGDEAVPAAAAAAAQEAGDDEGDEDEEALEDAAIASNLREILGEKLGVERCRGVLAALYVARSDVSAMVRQMAFGVWKSLVSNTPRTVRECLPYIVDVVLGGLASDAHDRRTSAARTLGDLVHKLGDAVMSRVVPILERALDQPSGADYDLEDDDDGEEVEDELGSIRHGVFIGLTEILGSAGKAHVDAYADAMVPLVRRGLCDADPLVREAAAAAFNALQQTAGPRVVDAIVPPLLAALQDASSPYALDALRELMAVRAQAVFPVLIPTLTHVPVSAFNARALAALIQVAGAGLSRRLPAILRALVDSMGSAADEDTAAALRDAVAAVAQAAVQDELALDLLVAEMHAAVRVPEACDLATNALVAARVAEACSAFGAVCVAFGPASAGRGRSPLGAHVADWLRILIELLGASEPKVVAAAHSALDALCRAVPKEDYDGYVGPVSRAVQQATGALPGDRRTLPGFDLPKGLAPLLPIYAQGLLAGSPDTKERAVRGMARLVRFTDPAALRMFATGITGPLIRIVGDRNPANVKAAILATLGLLLGQVPQLMRPFLPQLQRTFVRGLSEPDDLVRRRAAAALAALIPLQPRLDPLVAELAAGLRAADDLGVKMAVLSALRAVVARAPNAAALSSASMQAIEDAAVARGDVAALSDARWRALAAQTFGALCAVKPREEALGLLAQYTADDVGLEFLASALTLAPGLFDGSMLQHVVDRVDTVLAEQGSGGALQAVAVARNALMNRQVVGEDGETAARLLDKLVRVVDAPEFDSDAQHAALVALKTLAKHRFGLVAPLSDRVVVAALGHVRDRVVTVKLAAERCLLYALRLARVPSEEEFDGDTVGLDKFVAGAGGPASEKGKMALDYH